MDSHASCVRCANLRSVLPVWACVTSRTHTRMDWLWRAGHNYGARPSWCLCFIMPCSSSCVCVVVVCVCRCAPVITLSLPAPQRHSPRTRLVSHLGSAHAASAVHSCPSVCVWTTVCTCFCSHVCVCVRVYVRACVPPHSSAVAPAAAGVTPLPMRAVTPPKLNTPLCPDVVVTPTERQLMEQCQFTCRVCQVMQPKSEQAYREHLDGHRRGCVCDWCGYTEMNPVKAAQHKANDHKLIRCVCVCVCLCVFAMGQLIVE